MRAVAALRIICSTAILSVGLQATTAVAGCGQHPGYQPVSGTRTSVIELKPSPELAALGQRLFFDTRFSATGATACARCHEPGYAYTTPLRANRSDNGRPGRRNSPSLLDVGFRPALMWDGRFCSLEQQALGPFESGEMGISVEHAIERVRSDPKYVDMFQRALGSFPSVDGFTRALAGYQRTLFSRESRVDRFLAGNEPQVLSPPERHGLDVFTKRAGCTNCHQLYPVLPDGLRSPRALLTDFRFHNIGIGYQGDRNPDPGRYAQSRDAADWGAFLTPSLRNVARTAPYMHDGSFTRLEDVVEFYSAGARRVPNLSPQIRPLHLDGAEKAALVAFLRALSN